MINELVGIRESLYPSEDKDDVEKESISFSSPLLSSNLDVGSPVTTSPIVMVPNPPSPSLSHVPQFGDAVISNVFALKYLLLDFTLWRRAKVSLVNFVSSFENKVRE